MRRFKKHYRAFVLVLFMASVLFALSWLAIKIINKDIYLCPKGSVPIGNGKCGGTGVLPK